MSERIDILAIDDDKFVQKMLARALDSEYAQVRIADDGEQGLELACENIPDIILLDVEMPGINGYETCQRLRNSPTTCNVPIIFLSSHSSLKERMQGYEAGGDDYLVKPFEDENLKARIDVLFNYSAERSSLKSQFQIAQKTAVEALTNTSELGLAIQFLEKTIGYQSVEELMIGLLESLQQFGLNCCAMIGTGDSCSWFSDTEATSPIEKELLEMSDRDARFVDFGQRTIVNFPMVSLLVRNMPLEDLERYGRLKDLLPIFLSSVNTKLSSLETQIALNQQTTDMLNSYRDIRRYLYHMGTTIVNSREDGKDIMDKLVQNLQSDLLAMGLEEDQEDFLLNNIDEVLGEVMAKLDAGSEIRTVLSFILSNLKSLFDNQQTILEQSINNISEEASKKSVEMDTNVELF